MAYPPEQAVIPGFHPIDPLEAQLAYYENSSHDLSLFFCQGTTVPQGINCAGNASFSSNFALMQPPPPTLSPTQGSSSGVPLSANTDHSSPTQYWLGGGSDILELSTDFLSPGHFDTFEKFNFGENAHMEPTHPGHGSLPSDAWPQTSNSGPEALAAMPNTWYPTTAPQSHAPAAADPQASYQHAQAHMMPSSAGDLNYGYSPDYGMPAQSSANHDGTSVTQAATAAYTSPPIASWTGEALNDTGSVGMHYRYLSPPNLGTAQSLSQSQAITRALPPAAATAAYFPSQYGMGSQVPRTAPQPTWHTNEPWGPMSLRNEAQNQPSAQCIHQELSIPSHPVALNPASGDASPLRQLPTPRVAARRQSRNTRSTQGNTSSSGESSKKRGGRPKGKRVKRQTREEAAEMRKVRSCWRCAMQREAHTDFVDPPLTIFQCDPNEPCIRCQQSAQRSHLWSSRILGCDRRKLEWLVGDFLPVSLTEANSADALHDFMTQRVFRWSDSQEAGLFVPLACGCGPTINWIQMWEFVPQDDDIHYTVMYPKQDAAPTRVKTPLLGLLRLEEQGYAQCDQFINRIISHHLGEFADKCFEDEHIFQQELLRLVCVLYRDAPRTETVLREQLKEVLRMLIATNIMTTTFSIPKDIFATTILPHLKRGGSANEFGDYPSPRIASHQLKFYFSRIRHDAYLRILAYLNSKLKAWTNKEATWLTAFCIVLGFAMVLEYCQQLIHMRSDARILRGQRDIWAARHETLMECKTIDEQYAFLVALFHNKYHMRNVSYAKLSDYIGTRPEDGAEITFIHGLQNLMASQADYLRAKKSTNLPVDHRQAYTSRLVTRLLDNFMGLQLGSDPRFTQIS
ncbi:hypothetical protein BDZ85DRAFT_283266 [Elsinoe ampelina]|uniref:Uncharacterized protein n=1 Tax=Elsinoe ampelina TaxID=302913 RepID=A0A6A6G900_9PEZI|nr:hypothetical protein BDZ85DRAFT_283266 [Elsinoe ampelina]